MASRITRRDFLDGFALAIASGLTPASQARADPVRYPPALTGLRGHHPGSFEIAHEFAREGRQFPFDDVAREETYDLVVVGGGISGLAAAYFYRQAAGPSARILILDNHDDFGGHAKRNEFRLDGRLVLGYGGSESLQSPATLFGPVAKDLLSELGVDPKRFETAFERNLYPSLGLSRGVFFPRETFGRDVLVAGDPTTLVADDLGPGLLNAKPIAEFIDGFPVSAQSKRQLLRLYDTNVDPLAGKTAEEKTELLEKTSYRDFLTRFCGCSEEAANCFQGRLLDFYGLGCDALPASAARDAGLPGFDGLGLPAHAKPEKDDPYIYHFPDGNASLARLLVRTLVPGVAPGSTMDDIVTAPFDYSRLDRDGNGVRVRLDSTCLRVQTSEPTPGVIYWNGGKLRRAEARHVVLACFNMIIPHLLPELPEPQREALARNVKTPLVYSKVLVRDWKPWVNLGVHEIAGPMSFHCRVKLDYPVSLGGYRHPRDPAEPIGLHMVHVPHEPLKGLDARDQFRIGRQKLLDMTFADFELRIRDELDRMLGPGGFRSDRDIAAITVNRWSHGYAYTANALFDGPDFADVAARARNPFGSIAIANSDAGWDAYAHTAIEQAHRAVRELLG